MEVGKAQTFRNRGVRDRDTLLVLEEPCPRLPQNPISSRDDRTSFRISNRVLTDHRDGVAPFHPSFGRG